MAASRSPELGTSRRCRNPNCCSASQRMGCLGLARTRSDSVFGEKGENRSSWMGLASSSLHGGMESQCVIELPAGVHQSKPSRGTWKTNAWGKKKHGWSAVQKRKEGPWFEPNYGRTLCSTQLTKKRSLTNCCFETKVWPILNPCS